MFEIMRVNYICPNYALIRLKHFSAFATSHIFGTMYARVLKFHICIAYEKLADLIFFFSIVFILLDL